MIAENTQFYQDLVDENKSISINGTPTSKGYYNLILSIRDLKLYAIGLKPHRFWKITDVKNYFGIKGNAKQMKEKLEEIQKVLTKKPEENV
jgi:hypothetical protein